MSQAIDNSNMLDYRGDQGLTGFVPNVTYAFDAEDEVVSVTDDSDFQTGVALGKVRVRVNDKAGNAAFGTIDPDGGGSGADGTVEIDVSDLDLSKPLDITATVLGNDGKTVADGAAYNIGVAGSLGNWDKQKNA